MERVVVALGGNALQDSRLPPTAKAQLQVIRQTAVHLVDVIEAGYAITLTHGFPRSRLLRGALLRKNRLCCENEQKQQDQADRASGHLAPPFS